MFNENCWRKPEQFKSNKHQFSRRRDKEERVSVIYSSCASSSSSVSQAAQRTKISRKLTTWFDPPMVFVIHSCDIHVNALMASGINTYRDRGAESKAKRKARHLSPRYLHTLVATRAQYNVIWLRWTKCLHFKFLHIILYFNAFVGRSNVLLPVPNGEAEAQ